MRAGATIPLRYNLRSLRVRWLTTSLTVGGVALVVATFVALMALASGFREAVGGGADPLNVVLMYSGGMSEAMSRVTVNQFQALRFLPQFERNARNDPLVSLEAMIQINMERKSGGETMILLRGVRPVAFEVHRRVSMLEGRPFAVQSGECVIGKSIAERHVGMSIGSSIRVGQRDFRIVGLMGAGGSAHEAEIWADLDDVIAAANRNWYNSISARLKSRADFAALAATIREDPRIDLAAKTEEQYYAEQAEGAEAFRIIGLIVAVFMGIGAALAEMNTMYAAVGTRTREIGTLRALGFGRRDILMSFLAEAVLLAIPGGLAGCLAGAGMDGYTLSVINMATVSEVSFRFQVTSPILAMAFLFSVVLGLVGGMLPALQAARLPVLEALRKV